MMFELFSMHLLTFLHMQKKAQTAWHSNVNVSSRLFPWWEELVINWLSPIFMNKYDPDESNDMCRTCRGLVIGSLCGFMSFNILHTVRVYS